MQRPQQYQDFVQKDTLPHLNERGVYCDKFNFSYDLVEEMQYLYVRVVKARDLPGNDVTGSCDPYVDIKLGNCKGTTGHLEKKSNPEWNQVFAFSKEDIEASIVEVVVKDKDFVKDDFMGRVLFDLNEVPKCFRLDGALAPQWYILEDRKGRKTKGELMVAVWMGTQADEAYPEAWNTDAAAVSSVDFGHIRSKVYFSPKLWHMRVHVIEAQDLQPGDKGRYPQPYVKAILGKQDLRTQISKFKSINPVWNEELMFVAAEPFEQDLILSVEERLGPNNDEILGRCVLPLQFMQKRLDHKLVNSRWYNLEKHIIVEGEKKKDTQFTSKIHLRICLDDGYHVLDESTHYSSDLRPTANQLWKSRIGILELGILNAQGLIPMKAKDGTATTDAYCIAKYGQKWVRTRTVVNSLTPKWNEQYAWEVFDPCTVITIGVFDNGQLYGGDKAGEMGDQRIGKVRIRLSTLETDRVYTHSYPLLLLLPSGLKKMGQIQLVVRFRCSSMINMLHIYSQPLLPRMHYIRPLPITQLIRLRDQTIQIVSMRLSRMEPPLKKDVVEYMLDVDSYTWSLRKSKVNFFRIMAILGGLLAVRNWFDQICNWENPLTTISIHILFSVFVLYPELTLPTIFLYLFFIGIWHFRWRPRYPPQIDTELSRADVVDPDELDEEFDTFPTSRSPDIVRMRYDRLRSITGRLQTVAGELATQGERIQALLSWRDPRATILFASFCLIAAIVLYATPVVALVMVFYVLRHPRLRRKHSSVPINFFRRLPSRTDSIL